MNLKFYTHLKKTSNSKIDNYGFKRVSKTLYIIIALAYASPLFAQTIPTAPTSVTAIPSAVCQGNTSSLKATSAGNIIRWYTVMTDGSPIGTSASGANFSVSPSTATTYYAEAFTTLAVASATRTAITINVNTLPVITSVPQDVNTSNEVGLCGKVVNYPAVTASGIPAPNIFYSNASGSNFEVGTTTVLTTAVNSCGNSSLSFDVTVNDNEAPLVVSPPDVSIAAPVGSTTVSGIDLGTPVASDNCGSVTISNDAPSVFPGGTTIVTWTVTDSHGHTATATQMVTVAVTNTAPVLNEITSNDADNIIAQYSSATLNISWADEPTGGPYSIDIDWRDSSAHTILTGITGHSAAPSHTYNKTGVFAPIIRISDGSNALDTLVFKYLVVYIVGNYSTTTEGEFTAPTGSLVSNPNMSCSNRKVKIGVECKPKCNHPGDFDGEIELEMNGGHFEFETEKIDWDYLAVSACFLATFQGTGYLYSEGHHNGCHGKCHGSCNQNQGQGNGHHYGILIVQSDKSKYPANANKIRIKIWDMNNGNAVLFDTQLGDPDYALPTTTLSKGCIKVRVPNNCVARIDDLNIPVSGFAASVTPNPFASNFNINVASNSSNPIQVEIFDMMGKLVQIISEVDANEPFVVDNNFPVGMYFVRISQDGNSQLIKMVKNNQ